MRPKLNKFAKCLFRNVKGYPRLLAHKIVIILSISYSEGNFHFGLTKELCLISFTKRDKT